LLKIWGSRKLGRPILQRYIHSNIYRDQKWARLNTYLGSAKSGAHVSKNICAKLRRPILQRSNIYRAKN